MTHARPGEPRCRAIWPLTGNPCKHKPLKGGDTCPAHHPDGDKRRAAPPDAERCTGANRESGERCRNRLEPGALVCDSHGGGAPQVRAAALARGREQRIMRIVDTYGLPIETTPEQAILDEVHRTAGHVAWLGEQVRALTTEQLVWGTTKVVIGGREEGTTEQAEPHLLLKLYQDERDRLVRVCAAALRAGIEERQVKLAEQQGALLVDLIKGILDDLKLTPEQKAMIPLVVPQHLRALREIAASN